MHQTEQGVNLSYGLMKARVINMRGSAPEERILALTFILLIPQEDLKAVAKTPAGS